MKQLSLSSKIMALFGGIVLLFLLNLSLGSLSIPVKDIWNICLGDREGVDPIWINIVTKSRLPQSITAISAGAGLAVSGLFMQTVFRNPLAGPSVLGISSGASLGVALVVLLSGSLGGIILSSLGVLGELAVTLGATLGALSVMIIIAYVSQKVKGNVTLLIIGVMIGYVANAVIGVLKYFSVEEDIKAYVVWGLGSFSRIGPSQVPLFSLTILLLLLLSILLIKTLNLMLLGKIMLVASDLISRGHDCLSYQPLGYSLLWSLLFVGLSSFWDWLFHTFAVHYFRPLTIVYCYQLLYSWEERWPFCATSLHVFRD